MVVEWRQGASWSHFSTMESSGSTVDAIRERVYPHFPLGWLSRRLCCRRASSLVTLIGFSQECRGGGGGRRARRGACGGG